MYEKLKQETFEANMLLPKYKLIKFTWGNVSIKEGNVIAIKPSGVPYEDMKVEDMVLVDIDGNLLEDGMKPSSDLATHLELYRNFPDVKSIVHTHSVWATIFAQAGVEINALGTTHSVGFYGDIPLTRDMTEAEIKGEYELETGKVIVERFKDIDPMMMNAVIVKNHGPFTWGTSAKKAVENAVVLEEVANMAWHTLMLNKDSSMPQTLMDKHYLRKHGSDSYYGQK